MRYVVVAPLISQTAACIERIQSRFQRLARSCFICFMCTLMSIRCKSKIKAATRTETKQPTNELVAAAARLLKLTYNCQAMDTCAIKYADHFLAARCTQSHHTVQDHIIAAMLSTHRLFHHAVRDWRECNRYIISDRLQQ